VLPPALVPENVDSAHASPGVPLDIVIDLCKDKMVSSRSAALVKKARIALPAFLRGRAMKDENGMPEKIETPESRLKSDLISLRTQFAILVKELLLKWSDEEIHSVVRNTLKKRKRWVKAVFIE
jgi:hypothetical protein